MRKRRGIGDWLAWLGGAQLDVLAQVPYERARFIQMALVLLTTSGIGTLSMMFALYDGVHVPLAVAIVGGLVWGFIILNLDRFLVLSMGHTRDWKRLVLMALPRLCLAVVISLVVATPLTLRIFASDIQNQMTIEHTAESAQLNKAEQNSQPVQQLNKVNKQIAYDQEIENGADPNIAPDPAVVADQQQVNKLQTQVTSQTTVTNAAYDKWTCEEGGAGSTCAAGASNLAGDGVRAHNDQLAYQQDESQLALLKSKLAPAEAQLAADQKIQRSEESSTQKSAEQQAKQDQVTQEQQKVILQNEISQQTRSDYNSINSDTGILAQLQDLSDASAQNPVLATAQWVVTLLFFFIEILPVMVKVLLNIGPLSTYEKVLKTEEDIIADRVKLMRVTKRRDSERAAEKDIAVDEDMRKREEALGIRANQFVADHMEIILDAALAEWSRRAQAQLNVQLPPGTVLPGTRLPGTPPGAVPGTGAGGGRGGRGLTSPQQRLGITGPQATLNATGPQSNINGAGANGAGRPYGTNGNGWGTNGNGWSNGNAPTVTRITQQGGGYVLPDDDGDVL